jgi:hypothetical protein
MIFSGSPSKAREKMPLSAPTKVMAFVNYRNVGMLFRFIGIDPNNMYRAIGKFFVGITQHK